MAFSKPKVLKLEAICTEVLLAIQLPHLCSLKVWAGASWNGSFQLYWYRLQRKQEDFQHWNHFHCFSTFWRGKKILLVTDMCSSILVAQLRKIRKSLPWNFQQWDKWRVQLQTFKCSKKTFPLPEGARKTNTILRFRLLSNECGKIRQPM